MNNLKLLLKINLMSLFGFNKAIHSKDPTQKKKLWGFSIMMILVSVMLVFVSFMYSILLAKTLEPVGAMSILLALMMMASCMLTIFTTVYKVNGVLFGFREYDRIISLPIKTSTVVASRILILYGMNFAFCCLVMVPAGVIYFIKASVSFSFIPIFLVTLFLIPLIPVVFAAFFGAIISIIANKFKHKSLFGLIFTFAFFLAIMVSSMRVNRHTMDFQAIGQILLNSVKTIYPPAYLYVQGVCENNFLSLFWFVFSSIAVFAVFVFLVAKYFNKINTFLVSGRTVSHYKLTSLKETTPLFALYKKEIKRYFTSTIYVFNTGFGMVLLVLLSFGILFMGPQILEHVIKIPIPKNILNDSLPIFISFCVVMSCTSVCSISLEGKNLWIVKSIPVSTMTVFFSKIAVNLTILIPPVTVSSAVLCFAIRPALLQGLMLFLLPYAYCIFISLLGIVVNVAYPIFDWQSDVTVVKQSAATIIAILFGFLSMAIPIILLNVLPKDFLGESALLSTLIIVLLDFLLYRYIRTKSVKKFELL